MPRYILHDTVMLLKSSAPLSYLLKEWLIDILCNILFPSKHTKLIPISSSLYIEPSLQVLSRACLLYSPVPKGKHRSLYLRRVVQAPFSYHLQKNNCVFYPETEVPAQWHRPAHVNQAIASSVHETIVSHQKDLEGKRSNTTESPLTMPQLRSALYLTPQQDQEEVQQHLLLKTASYINSSTCNCVCTYAFQQEGINLGIQTVWLRVILGRIFPLK